MATGKYQTMTLSVLMAFLLHFFAALSVEGGTPASAQPNHRAPSCARYLGHVERKFRDSGLQFSTVCGTYGDVSSAVSGRAVRISFPIHAAHFATMGSLLSLARLRFPIRNVAENAAETVPVRAQFILAGQTSRLTEVTHTFRLTRGSKRSWLNLPLEATLRSALSAMAAEGRTTAELVAILTVVSPDTSTTSVFVKVSNATHHLPMIVAGSRRQQGDGMVRSVINQRPSAAPQHPSGSAERSRRETDVIDDMDQADDEATESQTGCVPTFRSIKSPDIVIIEEYNNASAEYEPDAMKLYVRRCVSHHSCQPQRPTCMPLSPHTPNICRMVTANVGSPQCTPVEYKDVNVTVTLKDDHSTYRMITLKNLDAVKCSCFAPP